MAGAASQAGDADSSQAPGLTSCLHGSVNVRRGALLSVATVTVHQFFCILHNDPWVKKDIFYGFHLQLFGFYKTNSKLMTIYGHKTVQKDNGNVTVSFLLWEKRRKQRIRPL